MAACRRNPGSPGLRATGRPKGSTSFSTCVSRRSADEPRRPSQKAVENEVRQTPRGSETGGRCHLPGTSPLTLGAAAASLLCRAARICCSSYESMLRCCLDTRMGRLHFSTRFLASLLLAGVSSGQGVQREVWDWDDQSRPRCPGRSRSATPPGRT